MRKHQNGFSIVELVLVLVIVGLICFIGYFVWISKLQAERSLQTNLQANRSATVAKTGITNNDKSTWKIYTSKVEGLSFKYPSNWKITYHKVDALKTEEEVRIKGTNNFVLDFHTYAPKATGADCAEDPTNHLAVLTVPNYGKLFIDVPEWSDGSTSNIWLINYNSALKDGDKVCGFSTFNSKRTGHFDGVDSNITNYWISFSAGFENTNGPVDVQYATFISSPEYKTTLQIFNTLSY